MPLVNRIYAYYQDNNDKRQLDLIPLWLQQWRAHGWEPSIVGLTQAQLDPRYSLLVAKARKVPCINPLSYQTANFVRWLAFAAIPVSTPVAIADYDVFPIAPFPPFETPADGPIISFD